MKNYTIIQTEGPPISFDGELLADVSSELERTTFQLTFGTGRHHQLKVFKTDSLKYVIEVRFFSGNKGESSHTIALIVDNALHIVPTLMQYRDKSFPRLSNQSDTKRLADSYNDLMSRVVRKIPESAIRV